MAFTINKATGSINTGTYIYVPAKYISTNGSPGTANFYAYKIFGTKGDFTFAGSSSITSSAITPAIMSAAIGQAWRTGLTTAFSQRVRTLVGTHYVATLKFSINGTHYASDRILNQAAYQSAKTTQLGFPSGAGAGAVNVGRFFGDPKNPRNYGLFTPDGRRIGN